MKYKLAIITVIVGMFIIVGIVPSSAGDLQDLLNSYSFDYYGDTIDVANITDFMTDTNGNSVNDLFNFNLSINNATNGVYTFYVDLIVDDELVTSSATKNIVSFPNFAIINMSTKFLSGNSFNFTIRVYDSNNLLVYREGKIQTQQYGSYEQGHFINSITDSSVNNDLIRVNLTVVSSGSSTENVSVFMRHDDRFISSNKQISFVNGTNLIYLDFDNETIKSTHYNGTFLIDNVEIGQRKFFLNHTTNYYDYEDFATTSYIKSYEDSFLDLNSNNLTDYLQIDTTLNIKSSGIYTLEEDLFDFNNQYLGTFSINESLGTGNQIVTLNVSGQNIYGSHLNGPFKIVASRLILNGEVVDSRINAHVTNISSYRDYERPPLPDLNVSMQVTYNGTDNLIDLNIGNEGNDTAFNIFVDVFDSNNAYHGKNSLTTLNSSSSQLFSFVANGTPEGSIFVAVVDIENLVDESDEINNIADNIPDNLPSIAFAPPTPDNGSNQTDNSNIYVNISSSDQEGDHYTLLDFNSDLSLWIRMDEVNASGDPTDISTYSRNGSRKGDATKSIDGGQFGDSFILDGNGDYIEVPNANGGNMTEATLSLWVNFDNYNQNHSIIYRAFGHGLYPRMNYWHTTGNVYLQYQIDGVTKTINAVGYGQNYSAGTWHNIVAIFDVDTGVKLYVDGELSSSDATTGVAFNGGTNSILLGRDSNLNYYLDGSIDEVLTFSRSLSQQEVKALYSASANQYKNNFTGLDTGSHNFIGHAVDEAGNMNSTELRTVNILSAAPEISFELPTPTNSSQQNDSDFRINVSVTDTDDYYVLTDIDNDLRLWMRFDDLDGSGDPYDLSSYGNNGTLEGAVIDENGYWGDGAQFDGIDDFVNLTKPESLQFDNEGFTIAGWAKIAPNSTNYGRIIGVDSGGAGSHGYLLGYEIPANKWFFKFANGTENLGVYSTSLLTNDWVFVVGQYNGTDNVIYINGVEENNKYVGEIRTDWSQVPAMTIGSRAGSSNFFNGSIDEVVIFKRVLSEDEIIALYSASANRYDHNFPKMTDGTHDFVAHAVDEAANRDSTETRTIFIDNLDLNALEEVYSSGTERVFRFLINNTLGSSISGINWKVDTGEDTLGSETSMDLTSNEEGYVFIYHNYGSSGTYRIRATAESSSYIDMEDLIITI
ncbi:hypothetical protein CO038_00655 [Candidatus Pacearchaeota archaeon CG_4_9_14_0_2_um_filter_39_13]|nr:MAG: hypothetical protein CO038_00655 [Candidatus Pacearchaeota archaeon CG_4_9_14_0_2_um_filter_39_13]